MTDSNLSVNRGAVVSPIVLLHLPNCLQFAVLAFGVLASGLTVSTPLVCPPSPAPADPHPVALPLFRLPVSAQFTAANPVLTPSELAHILALSQPSVLVTTPAGLPTFQAAFALLSADVQAKLAYPTRGNVFLVDLEHDDYGASASSLAAPAEGVIGGWNVQNWKVLLPSATNSAPFSPPKYVGSESALRAAVIFWSSGTSGKSKGVILSHKACSSAIISVWHYAALGADERLVGLPPFYHIFGWANTLMISPAFGATTTTIQKVSKTSLPQQLSPNSADSPPAPTVRPSNLPPYCARDARNSPAYRSSRRRPVCQKPSR